MHRCNFVRTKVSENKIPFIMLPDATGSCGQLTHLGRKLNRNVLYINDGRLYASRTDLPINVTLEELVTSYVITIQNALLEQEYKLPIPFVLVGYSGGGILANLIQKELNEEYPGHAISIIIDSITPEVIKKWESKSFAEHLRNVISKIGEKYKTISVADLSELPEGFEQLPPLEQIEAVKNKIKYTNVKDPFQTCDFHHMIKVMLANHKCYIEYNGKLNTVKQGLIFVAQDTLIHFRKYLTNVGAQTLGYAISDKVKIVNIKCDGIDHSTVLSDAESCEIIRRHLVEKHAAFSCDREIKWITKQAKLEQAREEILNDSSSSDDDEVDYLEGNEREEVFIRREQKRHDLACAMLFKAASKLATKDVQKIYLECLQKSGEYPKEEDIPTRGSSSSTKTKQECLQKLEEYPKEVEEDLKEIEEVIPLRVSSSGTKTKIEGVLSFEDLGKLSVWEKRTLDSSSQNTPSPSASEPTHSDKNKSTPDFHQ